METLACGARNDICKSENASKLWGNDRLDIFILLTVQTAQMRPDSWKSGTAGWTIPVQPTQSTSLMTKNKIVTAHANSVIGWLFQVLSIYRAALAR